MGSSGGTGSQAQPESRTLVRVHMAPHSVIQQQAKRHHATHLFTPHGSVDECARDIGRSKHFITMDLESGFWQVLIATKRTRDRTAFFVPGGQKRWTVMPEWDASMDTRDVLLSCGDIRAEMERKSDGTGHTG
jgi:hypothetical protein